MSEPSLTKQEMDVVVPLALEALHNVQTDLNANVLTGTSARCLSDHIRILNVIIKKLKS